MNFIFVGAKEKAREPGANVKISLLQEFLSKTMTVSVKIIIFNKIRQFKKSDYSNIFNYYYIVVLNFYRKY